MNKIILVTVAAIGVFLTAGLIAAPVATTQIQTRTVATGAGSPSTVTFDQLPPSTGTPVEVRIRIRNLNAVVWHQAENTGSTGNVRAKWGSEAVPGQEEGWTGAISFGATPIGSHTTYVNVPQTVILGAYDGTTDYAGTSGYSNTGQAASSNSGTLATWTSAPDLAVWAGTGTVVVTCTKDAVIVNNASGSLLIQTTGYEASYQVQVEIDH